MPAPRVETIGDVLDALDRLVDRAVETRSRLGYFAAIYHQVTARIAEGITTGAFEDGARMERFDVAFAQRYLTEVETAFAGGAPKTMSFELAARAAESSRPIILQHLLLGINFHINIDLGVAAAMTAPGDALPTLRRDFDLVNEIIAALVAGVEEDLAEISPLIGLLDVIGGRHDEEVIRFSIEVARAQAWRFALELAPLQPADWPGPIRARDARVAHVARAITNPGLLSAGLLVIRAGERQDVRHNIEVLARTDAPDLAEVAARATLERAAPPER
jgi:hypothetical protein